MLTRDLSPAADIERAIEILINANNAIYSAAGCTAATAELAIAIQGVKNALTHLPRRIACGEADACQQCPHQDVEQNPGRDHFGHPVFKVICSVPALDECPLVRDAGFGFSFDDDMVPRYLRRQAE